MLTKVTMTGADDDTSINELLEISARFPFVEWGILVGSSSGKERFPSVDWIRRFVDTLLPLSARPHLALHVCGRLLREIRDGRMPLVDHIGYQVMAFRRVQLNWHGDRQQPADVVSENVLRAFCTDTACLEWDPEIIFQLDGVNDDLWRGAGRKFCVSGLFDASHGAGVAPQEWPDANIDTASGWAGGLGPHNLADELPRIAAKALPAMSYWIDMETHVRSNGKLDLQKVIDCLKICEPHVER